jgi:dimethylamine/trimethylamine dehydrogenase
MDGTVLNGEVIIYDDDHYVMGGAIAERLAQGGARVTLITPAPLVSFWTQNTLEQAAIERRLIDVGVTLLTRRVWQSADAQSISVLDELTERVERLACEAIVLCGGRVAQDALARELFARREEWADAGVSSVTAIGDALAPAMIVHAVYAGHRYARELGETIDPDGLPFLRQVPG